MTSFIELEGALSSERLERYLVWAQSDTGRALQLYKLNTQLSEALYTPLQVHEVVLRNAIHGIMSQYHGPNWFEEVGILRSPHQCEQIGAAVEELQKLGKPVTPGRVVAALTFSFWTAMFSPVYDELWKSRLHLIAISDEGRRLPRKALSRPLTQIRLLRNRIAHHEPILHWDLQKHHLSIVTLTRWLSRAAAEWCFDIDRFPTIYPAEGFNLGRKVVMENLHRSGPSLGS
jgi:Abi-like protein